MKLGNYATKNLVRICVITCLAHIAYMPAAMKVPMPGDPKLQMPMNSGPMPQGFPGNVPQEFPGNIPTPSAAEIEDAFAKVEKIQQEDPALFKQLEEAGKEIIKELAKQDPAQLEEFAKSFGLSPEELLKEAEKPSAPMPDEQPTVIEPEETTPPEEEVGEEPQESPKQPEQKKITEEPPATGKKPIPVDEGRVRRIIAQVAEHTENLRNKMASSDAIAAEFGALQLDLLSLTLLAAIIDNPEHIKRLSSGEYQNIINALENLAVVFITQEPLIQAFRPSQTPYDLLGVSPQVTLKQLEKAFENLKKRLDPKAVEKRLKKSGLKDDDLRRQVKAAKITFSEIEEAYDLVADPITRRDIVDRAIELEAKQNGIDLATSKTAINEIREALSTALYKDELISKLENYLERYAPEELKLKKLNEKEMKKRLEEHKRLARRSPVITHGGTIEPVINIPSPNTSSSYLGSYPSPVWTPEPAATRYQPNYPDFSPAPTTPQQTQSQPEKREEGQKQAPQMETQGEREGKKIDPRPVKDIVSSLDRKAKEFSSALNDGNNQKIIKKILEEETPAIKKLETEFRENTRKLSAAKAIKEQKKSTKVSETQEKISEKEKTEQKVLSKEEEDALLKSQKTTEADLERSKNELQKSIETYMTGLKFNDFYKELDTLYRIVNKRRAKGPSEAEIFAWDKFKETYEKNEKATQKDTQQQLKAPAAPIKARPALKGQITDLRKKFKTTLKQAESDNISLPELEDLNTAICKNIPTIIKNIDRWFNRPATVEQPKTETPSQTSSTKK